MSFDNKGELKCPYCGTKAYFSDTEIADYRNFRINMLQYLRSAADLAADSAPERMWLNTENVYFYTTDETKISISYLFYSKQNDVDTYVTKQSIVFVFNPNDISKAQKMTEGLQRLEYPAADIKNLKKYFPSVVLRNTLQDGSLLVAISKPENVYPVFAFGNVKPEHAAWMVSRMENLCCVLEYSGLVHNGITVDSVYVNPRTHEGYLYGGWWNSYAKTDPSDNKDLWAIRDTADKILGEYKNDAPKEFRNFIKNAPAADAYSDFLLWDNVIEKGFGGHKFRKFNV